jgi:Flp pilus assembly protein TadG
MRHRNSNHRGVVLIYVTLAMVVFIGIVSLAIDVAHVRLVKIELQGAADAAAMSAASVVTQGASPARANAVAAAAINYADGTAVSLNTTTDVVFGTWNAQTATFTASSGWSSSVNAVQVIARRTALSSNPVQIFFAKVLGISTVDVTAKSVGYLIQSTSTTVQISGLSDPWLAGMPSGSTASYDDTAPGESPTQVTGISVIPGSYITLSNVSGAVNHAPGLTYDGPTGNTSQIFSHGADSPGGPTPAAENGVSDILVPIDSLLGVFLTANAPNTQSAPARLDYSTQAARDQAVYNNLQTQQTFYIGTGSTSSGTVQQFRVPPGATRLFLGTMDGHEWNNNAGSFTATITVPATVQLVQ